MNPMSLSDKQVLITGASSGIGRQVAITCSQLGATVVLMARRENMLQETMTMLEGSGHAYYLYDLANVEGIEKAIKEICDARGVFHGLVHCAGVSRPRILKQLKHEGFINAMNINYYSFAEITRCLSSKKDLLMGAVLWQSLQLPPSEEERQIQCIAHLKLP